MNADVAFRAAKHALATLLALLALGSAAPAQEYPSVPDRRRMSWRVWSPTVCSRSTPPAHLSLRTSLGSAAISALTLSRRPRLIVPPSGSASAGPSQSTPCCSRACLTIRAKILNQSPNLLPSRACSRSIRRRTPTPWRTCCTASQKSRRIGARALSQFAAGHPRPDSQRCTDRLSSGNRGYAARRNGRGEDSRRLYRATLSLFAKRATLKESGIDVEADAWDGLIAPGRCCARNWQPN